MTTTPHPTDALPLPELPTTSYLGDGNGYGYDSSDMYAYGLIVRREGYELAMSNTRERLAALAEEFEAAIPTDAGLVLAAMIREGVTALGSHIGYAAQSLAAPTPDHSPGNMTQPIHDPAVTTPREVLVGESPVDRIAAPAQEQPVEDEAQALIDAGHAFWNSCKSLGGGAVRWLQCEDGTLIIFTRGEYRERLMSRICADCSAPQYVYQSGEWQALSAEPKQQAGAAEVSDEQIEKLAHRMCWQYRHSSDPHHSSTYKFNLTTLLEYTRAALKAGGVAEVSDEMISQALAAACFFDTKQSRKDMRNALEAALKAGGVA